LFAADATDDNVALPFRSMPKSMDSRSIDLSIKAFVRSFVVAICAREGEMGSDRLIKVHLQ